MHDWQFSLHLMSGSWLGQFALMSIAMAFAVAFFSATQDIVIDAFRIEKLEPNEQAAGATSYVYGYRIGMLASGAGALYLASSFS